jgi:hypothetical protein
MQGTVVVLMALSGMGCHNKYAVAYPPPTYSALFAMSGCYANYYPNFLASAYGPGCYGGGYPGMMGACYGGGGCYAYRPRHTCCFLANLVGCCGCMKGGPYYGAGYMGYAGAGPFMGGPGPFMDGPGPFMGPGPMMGGPGPFMDGPGPYVSGQGMIGPYAPPIFGYALQFNYGDPTVDSVPVPTVPAPASSTGSTPPAPPPAGSTSMPPPAESTTPPTPPPPTPANVPGANPPKPRA